MRMEGSASSGARPMRRLSAAPSAAERTRAIWRTGRAIFGFRVPERLYADPFHRP